MNLRLAGIIKESVVDGPGLRFVVFAQGCNHHCKNCHNQETWDPQRGYEISIDELLEQIKGVKLIKGVTLSGGDPFLQAEPFALLAKKIKEQGLDVMTYTGYTYEELLDMANKDNGVKELLAASDILVDGPYIDAKRDISLAFRGSKNQRLIDLKESMKTGEVQEIKIETKPLGEW